MPVSNQFAYLHISYTQKIDSYNIIMYLLSVANIIIMIIQGRIYMIIYANYRYVFLNNIFVISCENDYCIE